jgi:uncharacterized membrane protein YgcG
MSDDDNAIQSDAERARQWEAAAAALRAHVGSGFAGRAVFGVPSTLPVVDAVALGEAPAPGILRATVVAGSIPAPTGAAPRPMSPPASAAGLSARKQASHSRLPGSEFTIYLSPRDGERRKRRRGDVQSALVRAHEYALAEGTLPPDDPRRIAFERALAEEARLRAAGVGRANAGGTGGGRGSGRGGGRGGGGRGGGGRVGSGGSSAAGPSAEMAAHHLAMVRRLAADDGFRQPVRGAASDVRVVPAMLDRAGELHLLRPARRPPGPDHGHALAW